MEEEKIKKYYEENPEGIDPIPEIEEIYEMHELIKESVMKISPKNLLDAGCGKGFTGKSVLPFCQKYDGFDISHTAVSIAQQRIPEGSFKVGSIKELPYEDEQFDCVVCSEVLEHIPDYAKAIKELSRVTKKNGSLVITTPNRYNPDMSLKLFTQGKYTSQIYDCPIDYNKLIEEFKKSGLEVSKFHSFWFFPALGEEMDDAELKKHMETLKKLSETSGKPLGLYLFFELKKK